MPCPLDLPCSWQKVKSTWRRKPPYLKRQEHGVGEGNWEVALEEGLDEGDEQSFQFIVKGRAWWPGMSCSQRADPAFLLGWVQEVGGHLLSRGTLTHSLWLATPMKHADTACFHLSWNSLQQITIPIYGCNYDTLGRRVEFALSWACLCPAITTWSPGMQVATLDTTKIWAWPAPAGVASSGACCSQTLCPGDRP